ncbi:hypothetical protein [Halostagnicola sp. A-GB9-2]|uniref:DUF7547 family protein n=1 Tax=Halostagnicola sp. A-GB9-2 TaxID=3048066 RepID=UPI0024BFD1A0|nr:hypothetical protein [Halostagnicola sp. A-GB9-2]MDJ1433489.1 hypothetical protein [Halostagnicola sp. A-GB9-2]
MTDRDDDLAEAVRELSATIDELREELAPRRRRPSFRPPTPGEMLRVADEFAIPAALAVLKANVRALEAFQRGIKLVQTEQETRDRTKTAAKSTEKRAKKLRRTTVSQLDTVLEELQRGVSEGSVPADERVTDLLSEARELRDDVDRRLRDAVEETGSTDAQPIEIDGNDSDSSEPNETGSVLNDDDDSNVDVDAELETLKDQFNDDDPSTDHRGDRIADESDGLGEEDGDQPPGSDDSDESPNNGDGDDADD